MEVHWTQSPPGALVHALANPRDRDLSHARHELLWIPLSGDGLVIEMESPFRSIREGTLDPVSGEEVFRILPATSPSRPITEIPRITASGISLTPWKPDPAFESKIAFRLHDALDPLPGLPALVHGHLLPNENRVDGLWDSVQETGHFRAQPLGSEAYVTTHEARQLQRPVWITGRRGTHPVFGSGIVLSSQGEILTAAHVLRDVEQESIRVFLPEGWETPEDFPDSRYSTEGLRVQVIGSDSFADLAVLRLDFGEATERGAPKTVVKLFERTRGFFPLFAHFGQGWSSRPKVVPSLSIALGHDLLRPYLAPERPHSLYLFEHPQTGTLPLLLPAMPELGAGPAPGSREVISIRHTGLQRGNSGSPLLRDGAGWMGLVFKKFFTREGELDEINQVPDASIRLARLRDYETRLRDEAKLPGLVTVLTPEVLEIIGELRTFGRVRPQSALARALPAPDQNGEVIDGPILEFQGAVFTLLPTRNWAYLLSQDASTADLIGGSSETPGGIGGGSSPRSHLPIDDFPEQKKFLESLPDALHGNYRQALLCLRTPGWKPMRLGGVTIEPGAVLRTPTRLEELESAIANGKLERLFPERSSFQPSETWR